MKTILCKNRYQNSSGITAECGRFLACLSDQQVEAMAPSEKSIFRCPRCRPEDRWVKVERRESGLVFAVCSPEERPDFKDQPQYDDVEVVEQVA